MERSDGPSILCDQWNQENQLFGLAEGKMKPRGSRVRILDLMLWLDFCQPTQQPEMASLIKVALEVVSFLLLLLMGVTKANLLPANLGESKCEMRTKLQARSVNFRLQCTMPDDSFIFRDGQTNEQTNKQN